MALVRKHIVVYEGDTPTPEQIKKLRALDNRPIVFDEDCRELSDAQLEKMAAIVRERDAKRERETLSLNVLPATVRAAEKYGADVMGRLLDLAVNDKELLQKCL